MLINLIHLCPGCICKGKEIHFKITETKNPVISYGACIMVNLFFKLIQQRNKTRKQ